MILGSTSFTRRRPAGSRTAAGVVDTATLTDATIAGSIQPEGGQDTGPERRRIYTASELRVADPETSIRADQVLLEGRPFDVIQVRRQRAIIPHYKALVEQEGTDIVTVSTPTGLPTIDNAAGTVTHNTTDTTIGTARIRKLTLREIESGAGQYQLGDVELSLKQDELPVKPTIDTTWTDDAGVRHAVLTVDRDLRRLLWVLTGRRIS